MSGTADALAVEGLSVGVVSRDVTTPIVQDISFSVRPGEMVALLGATGSGKTVTARALMGVLPPGLERLDGRIWLNGEELTALAEEQLQELRGRTIAYVPQNPVAALHPQRRVGAQMRTVMRDLRMTDDRKEAARRSLEALNDVRVRDPERVLHAFPHELSGGMAQRVLIAIALLNRPAVLVADEPTTGLDATVQAQVMDLIERRASELDAATLLVTHDLGLVARHCQRAVVVEDGAVTESATIEDLFARPASDYGQRLITAARRESAARAPVPPR